MLCCILCEVSLWYCSLLSIVELDARVSAVVIVYASSRAEIVAAYTACTFVTEDGGLIERMARQAATTCAAAVARCLEARGLPRIYRSPSPLQGGRGEWRRHACWRRGKAALRPVSPYRASSCQSRVVLLSRVEIESCCWPATVDLHADIPLLLFFVFVKKLNTVLSIATSPLPLQYHYFTRFLPTYLYVPHFPSVPSLLPYFLGIHPLTSAPRPVALHRLHIRLLLLPKHTSLNRSGIDRTILSTQPTLHYNITMAFQPYTPKPITDIFTNDTDINRRECRRVVPMRVLALGLGRTGTACK